MAAFPLVGLTLGALLFSAHFILTRHLPDMLEGVLLTALMLRLTGGLHMDGVADTIDGLSGGYTRERTLEIMKDSAVGAHGAAGLVMVLLAKAAAIGSIPDAHMFGALIAAPTVARGAMTLLAFGSTYARETPGLGSPYTEHLDHSTVATALGISLLASLAAGVAGLVAFGVALLWALFLKNRFHARLGGITGDILGFTEETGEVLAFVVILLLVQ